MRSLFEPELDLSALDADSAEACLEDDRKYVEEMKDNRAKEEIAEYFAAKILYEYPEKHLHKAWELYKQENKHE